MHRFGQHQAAESPGDRRPADDDAGFIGLPVRGAGDEILLGHVPKCAMSSPGLSAISDSNIGPGPVISAEIAGMETDTGLAGRFDG